MPVEHFDNIAYLKGGTYKQRRAYEVLTQYQIIDKLIDYTPILAGTIPINIDIKSSDLDIICCFASENEFEDHVQLQFSSFSELTIKHTTVNGQETIVANFMADGWEIEIFGQRVPVKQQAAYRHMLIEHHLLEYYGGEFRLNIISLKEQGYKTEPAFAKALNLKGDPYQALLNYKMD
jgi:hypothetical protein